MLVHLSDPDRGVRELIRVTKPAAGSGRDLDHGMWALDSSDMKVTRALFAWWFGFIANPWIARGMPARFATAGLVDVEVSLIPIVCPRWTRPTR